MAQRSGVTNPAELLYRERESLYRGGGGLHRIEALTRMAMVKSNAFSSSAISASYLLHNAFSLDLFEGRCQGMARENNFFAEM